MFECSLELTKGSKQRLKYLEESTGSAQIINSHYRERVRVFLYRHLAEESEGRGETGGKRGRFCERDSLSPLN